MDFDWLFSVRNMKAVAIAAVTGPLLAGALLLAFVSAADAEADGPDYFKVTGVYADDVLNIREERDAKSRKIGEIPSDGDSIKNLGCQGGLSFSEWQAASPKEREAATRKRWCRVSFKGVEGWVAGRFLAEGSYPSGIDAGASSLASWRLVSVNEQPALGDAEISFSPDGSISGSTGCNRFNGRGTVKDGKLTISQPFASTKMACPEAEIAAQEDQILKAVQGQIRIQFDPFSRKLVLENEASAVTLRLAAD